MVSAKVDGMNGTSLEDTIIVWRDIYPLAWLPICSHLHNFVAIYLSFLLLSLTALVITAVAVKYFILTFYTSYVYLNIGFYISFCLLDTYGG